MEAANKPNERLKNSVYRSNKLQLMVNPKAVTKKWVRPEFGHGFHTY